VDTRGIDPKIDVTTLTKDDLKKAVTQIVISKSINLCTFNCFSVVQNSSSNNCYYFQKGQTVGKFGETKK